MAALLETTMGDIVIDLYPEERPRCCLNFLKLCKMKYYNFNLFHSVQRNFMAQTGDPSGTGSGGQSIYGHLKGDAARFFDMEPHPRIKHKKKGSISMVNNGSNQHGSQFFITLREDIDYLDGIHTVFGEVTEGFDVLEKISETFCDSKHRPLQDIRINHTVILDDPFDDPEGLEFPDKSPEIDPYKLKSDRIAADEDVDREKEKSSEQLQEETKRQEAKANAQILEMIGDLPDADVKPPENVLFVCKLNSVTTSEDLEIIFSRFGKISSCEVIKDQTTGDSLCYAFVEFEREEDCEEAYFKMDNVLIDDRRIHVDFSQSVAKLQFKGRGPVMPQKPSNSQSGQRSRGGFSGNRRGNRGGGNRGGGNRGGGNRGGPQREDIPRMKDRRKDDSSNDSSSSSSSPERREQRGRGKTDRSRQRKDSSEEHERPVKRRDEERRDERKRDERRIEGRRDKGMRDKGMRDGGRRDEGRRDEGRRDEGMRDGSKETRMDRDRQEDRPYQEQQRHKRNERQTRGRSSSTERSRNQSSSRRREDRSDKRLSKQESQRKTSKRRSPSESSDSSSSSVDRRKSQKSRDGDSDETERMKRKKMRSKSSKDDRSPKRKLKKKRTRRSRSLSS